MADFAQSDRSSLVFIHYARLITIWGEIADFGISETPACAVDLERITDALCVWITDLPEEIRLFTPAGLRTPYLQSVSELHMVYFVTIILLEALRIQSHHRWSTSVPSIIAASSVVRLIEEVDCWEDLSSMSSTTTFYIMAASVPLIYHRPSEAEKSKNRTEDLQTLCTTLDRLGPRWGAAPVVRQNIDKIRNMVEWQISGQQLDTQEQAVPVSACASPLLVRMAEIFPFPQSLCPNMEMLTSSIDGQLDFGSFSPSFGDDTLPWAGTDSQSYLDFFRLDSYADAPNLGGESFRAY